MSMWTCSQCTYANMDTYDQCAICEGPPRVRPFSTPNPKPVSVPWRVTALSKKAKKPFSGTEPALKRNKHRIPCQVRGCQTHLSKRWRHGRADEAAACATEHCSSPEQRWICDGCWLTVHAAYKVTSPYSFTRAHLHPHISGTGSRTHTHAYTPSSLLICRGPRVQTSSVLKVPRVSAFTKPLVNGGDSSLPQRGRM